MKQIKPNENVNYEKKIKPHWYYDAYGRGANSKANGYSEDDNPFTYGTEEHDAWNHGWRGLR